MKTTRNLGSRLGLGLGLVALALSVGAQTDGARIWEYSTLSTAAAGGVVSSPTVGADGTVYFGIEIGSETSPNPTGRIYAITPDGDEKWTYDTDDWVDATLFLGADERLYFGDWSGRLHALEAATGEVVWTTDVGAFMVSSVAQGPDGTLYAGTGDSLLVAFDPATGQSKWSFPTEDWVFASTVVGPDGRIYFGSWDDRFYAVDPQGELIWSVLTSGDIVGGAALMADGTVVFGSRDRVVYAINADGTLRWSYETGDGVEAAPAIGPDGSVAIGSTDGYLYRLSADGALIWRVDLGGAVYSTPSWREDGSIIVGSSAFKVHALSASGSTLWTYETGDWVDSSPAVTTDGRIYITGYDKKLHALNSTVGAELAAEWGTFQQSLRRGGRQVRGLGQSGPGRLTNLSVRSQAGSGAETLIAGWVVGGSGARDLLLRGVGPTLAEFGVTGALIDPVITLFDGETAIAINPNWGEAADAAELVAAAATVGAFALPEGSLDAALLASQVAGAPRTLQVVGTAGQTGVALVEVYDVGGDATAELVNLSVRSQVGTGDQVLIAGLVVNDTTTLLLRGVGPTLADFEVTGELTDPVLQVYHGAELLAQGDDAGEGSDATLILNWTAALNTFPLPSGSKDAALIVTLPAGAYSAVVSGANQSTGVALIEVYLVRE